MKTRLLFTICLAIFLSASSALAQDVNGLKIGEKYTRSQIIKALGKPDSGSDEFCYIYGQSFFNFDEDDNTFTEFSVQDPRFITMTEEIEGGLRVGDDISKVKKTKCQIRESGPDYFSYWYYAEGITWNIIYDKKGKIRLIGLGILN